MKVTNLHNTRRARQFALSGSLVNRMSFRTYQGMLAQLIRFARQYKPEISGYFERTQDRYELVAEIGEVGSCNVHDKPNTFHTHPSIELIFSNADLLAFIVKTNQQETIVASQAGILIARKKDPTLLQGLAEIVKGFEQLIIYDDWSKVRETFSSEREGPVGPVATFAHLEPKYSERVFIFRIATSAIIAGILGFSPLDTLSMMLALEIEVEKCTSPFNSQQITPLVSFDNRRKRMQREIEEFRKDPTLWMNNLPLSITFG